MATSRVQVTEGSGKNLATYSFSEDAVTKEAQRVVTANSSGTEIGTLASPQYVSTEATTFEGRTLNGVYSTASFRIAGIASAYNVLAAFYNNSARVIRLRRIAVDYTAVAITTALPFLRYWHITGVVPTGGTAAPKYVNDSTMSASAAGFSILFAASADGTASAITHADPGTMPARQQAFPNLVTAAGIATYPDMTIVEFAQNPFVLRSGETSVLAQDSVNAATTQSYSVKVWWEEWT